MAPASTSEAKKKEKMMIVVITGTHNAGKSSRIAQLASQAGTIALSELGGDLRRKAACASWTSCEIFDELVMLREFERDHQVVSQANQYHFVLLEQWHIGNLAHALIRSPHVAGEYNERLKEYLPHFEVPILWLHIHISPEEALRREVTNRSQSETKAMDIFYTRLEQGILDVYHKLGINYHFINGERPVMDIFSKVKLIERSIGEQG